MGLPSPHDIYGILKYEDITYNLANRVFDKSLEKKLKEYVEKENISYFPIYPHIPKNPFTTYEIINNKLYITGISYNDKPYNIKEIFGKEMVECDFDITLKAVVNTTKFLVNTEYYKQEIKNFYFEKGVLKEIKDHIEINANLTRRLKGYWEIGEKQGYVGIFWILNNKIYSAKQKVKDFLGKQELEKVKFTLSSYEIWNFLKGNFKELSGLNSKELTSGSAIYDVKNDKFIIYSNAKIDKNLLINDFALKDSKTEFDVIKQN